MGPAQGTMGTVLWFTLLWTSGCGHSLAAQVLKRNIYFSCAQRERITLSVPSVTSGREFIWERTSHQHNNKTVKIAVIESSNEKLSWTHIDKFFKNGEDFEISMEPLFQNAGVFSFSQTRPENVLIARYEVFALKVEPEPPLWSSFSRGADVSASCTVSRLQDSATLRWEKEGPHTSNTTLSHKNAAHIIIHSADEHSEGRYSCSLERNGLLLHNVSNTLSVRKDTYHTSYNLYRDSSDSTEVVFVCASPSHHRTAWWAWVPFFEGKTKTLATAGKEGKVRISTEIDGERFLSDGYDGILFPLRISPVMFQDAGRYSCYVDNSYFSYITLITLQVSAEPPGGLSRNQSVVLNCEISQVIGSVTLAWLRMKGGRGELVKQEVLSEGHPEKMLSLTLPILSRDQLHWACAVFTESMLRAQVPLHLTLLTPITEPEEPKPDNGRMLVIGLACTAAVCVGVLLLLGGLLFRRLKTAAGPSTSPAEGNGAADAVYSDVTDLQQGQATLPVDGNGDSSSAAAVYSNVAELQKDQGNPDTPTEENDSEELQYLVFSLTTPSLDPNRQQRRQLNPQSCSEQEENDKVVYASICKT